ncbi:META and DUF4377 domain-containing protein [Acinetobacter populi]|uniref:DUF4377 domain-containing protein n=1 Tax=Acinetobacter populi TaxID=1582270 RepID=A0A1Z9YYX0_9GAMM|nr:META and DUF4377 domain-containing protein [Acinetobacter populi]OUY07367.1 hypothetical protein CAP51_06270 [Acinetobacter populi]
MKLKLISSVLSLSLASVLAACQTTPSTSSQKEAIHVKQHLQQTLQEYTWSYQPQQQIPPIVLSFQDNRIGIYSGCNRMGTDFSLNQNTLKTGNVISTQMACEPELMKQEQFAASLFQNHELTLNINTANPDQPILTVHSADGQQYQFVGTATPETKYQGQGEIVFLEVAPETKACVGVAAQQCLQVREIQYNAQGLKTATGDWELFYGQIEGFQHDPKLRTIIRTKRFTLKNPAADQSKYAYVHDMTVEQELVK